jgi:hypothetical protein
VQGRRKREAVHQLHRPPAAAAAAAAAGGVATVIPLRPAEAVAEEVPSTVFSVRALAPEALPPSGRPADWLPWQSSRARASQAPSSEQLLAPAAAASVPPALPQQRPQRPQRQHYSLADAHARIGRSLQLARSQRVVPVLPRLRPAPAPGT